ncbi:RNA-binding protein fusilli-like isoform X2 [Babylonia areolata]
MLQKTGNAAGAPSHLVMLFCVSGGKNGEELGSDEEQIVLLVYLLFDVYNNKVVSLQSHYVKPQPNELTETILTDDCKEETGLDENAVRNGQPLDVVLEELDRFLVAKGVHPDQGGRSFVFMTDGQCHIRQCLHHEACSKNTTLPTYYNKFYDLRKEFRKRYDRAGPVDSIKCILDYLGLEEAQSLEYGVRQCQEMAAIVSRLLNDGHIFGEPQVVNERLEGGICMKTEVVDDNTVVRARGLPWQSSDQDIARFFKGLNIAKAGVALCLSPQGRRNGEALIRFESEEQRDLALKRHKHHIGQRYIEVYKASGKDFINVAGGSNTEAQAFLSRGGQTIIRMRGLPFTATTAQVLEFFTRDPNASEVLDGEDGILFVHYPDGRSTGDAFVLFSNEEESLKALKKHREMMGTRYIELFKSTTAEVQQVLNRSMDPRNPDPPDNQLTSTLLAQFSPSTIPLIPQNFITAGTRRDCIRLRNLPGGAQVTDILTYLGEFSQYIQYQGVHMVYTAQGEPSGEAFIQLDSEDAALVTVLNRHRRPMIYANKKRIIDVLQCSGDDMSLVLANSIADLTAGLTGPFMPQVAQLPQVAQVPQMAPVSSMPVVSSMSVVPAGPPVPMTMSLQQRPMISPSGMVTAPTLQLTSPSPAQVGTMQVTQLPQHHLPPAAATFSPATVAAAAPMAQPAQRPAFYPPMLYW